MHEQLKGVHHNRQSAMFVLVAIGKAAGFKFAGSTRGIRRITNLVHVLSDRSCLTCLVIMDEKNTYKMPSIIVITREGGSPIHYRYGYVPPNGVVILKLLI